MKVIFSFLILCGASNAVACEAFTGAWYCKNADNEQDGVLHFFKFNGQDTFIYGANGEFEERFLRNSEQTLPSADGDSPANRIVVNASCGIDSFSYKKTSILIPTQKNRQLDSDELAVDGDGYAISGRIIKENKMSISVGKQIYLDSSGGAEKIDLSRDLTCTKHVRGK